MRVIISQTDPQPAQLFRLHHKPGYRRQALQPLPDSTSGNCPCDRPARYQQSQSPIRFIRSIRCRAAFVST
jgi:hypothetical protein